MLTAVEDLIAERGDLGFLRVPAIFGLGMLFRADAPWADEVRTIVGPLHENALLQRMERNRIELFLRFIDPHRVRPETTVAEDLVAAQQREIDQLMVAVSAMDLRAAHE